MKALPGKARAFVLGIVVAGLVSAFLAMRLAKPPEHPGLWELFIFMASAVFAGSRKVKLGRYRAVEDAGSMSLGFVITFATLMRFGPAAGMAVGTLSALSGCCYPKRQPGHQILFNVS